MKAMGIPSFDLHSFTSIKICSSEKDAHVSAGVIVG